MRPRVAAIAGTLLLACSAAHAEPLADWQALQQALLVEVVDGDAAGAARTWERLVRELGSESDVRAESLFWLGRANLRLGETPSARAALRECVRVGSARRYCLELLGQLERDESAIKTTPTLLDFSQGLSGFLHPWRDAERGTLRVESVPDAPAQLVWTTEGDAQRDDALELAFSNPIPPPRELSLHIVALQRDAWLQLEVYDIRGQSWVAEGDLLYLEHDQPRDVTLNLAALTPVAARGPFRPAELDRIVLRDVSNTITRDLGLLELVLTEVRVR